MKKYRISSKKRNKLAEGSRIKNNNKIEEDKNDPSVVKFSNKYSAKAHFQQSNQNEDNYVFDEMKNNLKEENLNFSKEKSNSSHQNISNIGDNKNEEVEHTNNQEDNDFSNKIDATHQFSERLGDSPGNKPILISNNNHDEILIETTDNSQSNLNYEIQLKNNENFIGKLTQ